MGKALVIDGDGHIVETPSEVMRFLPEEHKGRDNFWIPADSWNRTLNGTLGKMEADFPTRFKDMDAEGIDIAVLYATRGLGVDRIRDPEYAAVYCRAYDDFLADVCRQSPRFRGVALLCAGNLPAAVAELNRAVTKLGFVGGMLPAHAAGKDPGSPEFYPLYEEAQRLGVPIAIHASFNESARTRFSSFICHHTFDMATEMMAAMTGVILGGIPELFPRLRIGFLEAGVGWMPFWMDRMDSEYEKRSVEAPRLKARPSEYMRGGNLFYSGEGEEPSLSYAVGRIGEGSFLYASDYPHWDMETDTVEKLRARTDLSGSAKRKILGENAIRFYGLKV
ncbi:MAG: amidohydrolase [Deltaproteobacteria bacterium]|nr:amidohydrolase [Deltaproteobacteria bacterium]